MPELAWHFIRDDGRLRDGAPLRVGEWLGHHGPIELCSAGLHASTRALDALHWAPGSMVCRVAVGGEIEREDDKLVCSRRKPIWAFDATDALRLFARECALSVLHLWDAPAVVREYLETGDESIREAALELARSVTWESAPVAANASARCAAGIGLAWDAAHGAAVAAARALPCGSMIDVERRVKEYSALLESLLAAAAADFSYEICPAVTDA